MKKLLGILLAALLLLGLLPVTALADPSPTAISVGDASQLTAAIADIADGGTITLDDSFSSDDTNFVIPADKSIILNLNGKTITTTADPFLTVAAGATLTINDTVGGGGLHEKRDWSVLIKNWGTLVINAGTFTSESVVHWGSYTQNYGGEYAVMMETESTTTINGGTFNGTFYTNGKKSGQTLTINGGTFHKQLYLASANEVIEINGGTFDLTGWDPASGGEPSVIEIDAGTLNITGGTFKLDIDTTGNDTASTNNNGSGNYTGVIVACKPSGSAAPGSYGSAATVNISGGTFENNDGECLVAVDETLPDKTGAGTATFTISDDDVIVIGGLAIYDKSTNTQSKPSFTISDGKFDGEFTVYGKSEGSDNNPFVIVTGGYFTENPTEFVPEDEYLVRRLFGTTYSYRVISADDEAEDDDDDDDEEDLSVRGSGVEAERLNKATEEYQTLKSFAVSTGFKTGDIIASWDIDLDGKGPWKLTFELGKEYAGETVTIYHLKKNGDVETFVVTANKYGDAKITVDSASPFMVVEGKATTSANSGETVKEENPNTGVSDVAALVSALAVISLIAGAATAFKK